MRRPPPFACCSAASCTACGSRLKVGRTPPGSIISYPTILPTISIANICRFVAGLWDRVQKSVFEADLDADDLAKIRAAESLMRKRIVFAFIHCARRAARIASCATTERAREETYEII